MSTWEERMAERAHSRLVAEEETEREAVKRAYLEELRSCTDAGHEGHHIHSTPTGHVCSCGQVLGMACVAITDDLATFRDESSCSICGVQGFTWAGDKPKWA